MRLFEHDDDPGTPAEAADAAADGHDGKKPKGKKADHKEGLLVALSAAGVLVAFLTYRHLTGGSAPSNATVGGNPTGSVDPTASTGTVAGGATPDASYFQELQAEIEALQQGAAGTSTSNPPQNPNTAPSFLWGAAAAGARYIKNLATGVIYQINPANGSAYALSPLQYSELGNPTYTTFGTAPKPPGAKPSAPAPPGHPTPGPKPPAKPPARRFYTVLKGDTLSAIARKKGESLPTLESKNPQIKNYNLIYPGEHVYY